MKTNIVTYLLISVFAITAVAIIGSSCSGGLDNYNTYWYPDADGDGFGDSNGQYIFQEDQPTGYVASNSQDCDDTDASIYPGGNEIPDNTIDENCDGLFGITLYPDKDGDGYGNGDNPNVEEVADLDDLPDGFVVNNTDCNDDNANIHPGATEIHNNDIDDDCDGNIDLIQCETDGDCPEGTACLDTAAGYLCATIWYIDEDGDGFGSDNHTIVAIEQPEHYVANNDDCDDMDAAVNPDATDEAGDGKDTNCDGND